MNRRNMLLGSVAVLGLGGWYLTSNRAGTTVAFPDAPLPGAANAQTMGADVDTSGIVDMVSGNPDATVEVIEYASFTCPHCATFHTGPYKQLKSDYIDTGKIRFIYREVFFDRFGLWASLIARCAGPEKFFGMAELIYAGQSEWTRAGEPAAIVEELRKIGRLAGMENDMIEACLQDADKAQALVAWYQQNAEADGIDSTPTFVINGKKHSNMSYAEMQQVIDEALAG
jgi:protein-disulfide isomerase